MKTYTIQIGEQTYTVSKERYLILAKELDEKGRFYLEGNRFDKFDQPKFRVLEPRPDLPALAEGVFTSSPEKAAFQVAILRLHGSYIAEHWRRRRIHYSLALHVRHELQTWDAGVVWQYILDHYEELQAFNLPPKKEDPLARGPSDTSRASSFAPYKG